MRHVFRADAAQTYLKFLGFYKNRVKDAQESAHIVLAKQSLCSYISS